GRTARARRSRAHLPGAGGRRSAVHLPGGRARPGRCGVARGECDRHDHLRAALTPLAHGIGGASDLPIPFTYAVVGAAWALTFSFAILAFAWREPRLDPHSPGRALPAGLRACCDSPAVRAVLGGLGVAVLALALAIGVFGDRAQARNPLPGMVYIFLWVGVMVASLLVGPVW